MDDKHRGTNDNIQALVSDTYRFDNCLTFALLLFLQIKIYYVCVILFIVFATCIRWNLKELLEPEIIS
jgi:hypothetical protein